MKQIKKDFFRLFFANHPENEPIPTINKILLTIGFLFLGIILAVASLLS